MSLVLNVEILGEFKNLTKATQGSESELKRLNRTASKISSGMIRALGAIGVGFSLVAVTRQLEESAKAAVEDQKSMNLLALAMKNVTGTTDAQVKSAEKLINRMQFTSGVADDELRPAFQKLFIATKDVEESNRLLAIALDTSAATGKDLDAVSQAMAKSLAGSDTALLRLIPSLKGAKDPMAELEKTFKGAAAEAANTDPYMRMQVIFGEMQEQIGMALLPTLNKFSEWLATPEGQEKLQAIVNGVTDILGKFGELLTFVFDNKEAIITFGGAILGVAAGIKALKLASDLAPLINANMMKAFGWVGLVITAVDAINQLNSALAGGGLFSGTSGGNVPAPLNFSGGSTAPRPSGVSGNMLLTPSKPAAKTGTTVNVNVKNVTDAKSIITTVKQFEKSTGTTLAKALR